jgi:cytochrome P450
MAPPLPPPNVCSVETKAPWVSPEALTPSAVEEVLRYDSPVQMVMCFCTRDTHIGETSVPGGTVVRVLIGAANRDPAQFHAPDSFDIAPSE